MSDCPIDHERLYEFIDSELSPDADTAVREHMAVCERCRIEVEHQRAFVRRLRGIEQTAATDALRARIRSALGNPDE